MDDGTVKALKYLIRVSPAGEMQDIIYHLATLCGGQENMAQSPEVVQALQRWYE